VKGQGRGEVDGKMEGFVDSGKLRRDSVCTLNLRQICLLNPKMKVQPY